MVQLEHPPHENASPSGSDARLRAEASREAGNQTQNRTADVSGRLALVCNRFGEGVAGGAELVVSELGHGLRERGWEVEVITSAARDLYTWKNEFPEGESTEDGIRVVRF